MKVEAKFTVSFTGIASFNDDDIQILEKAVEEGDYPSFDCALLAMIETHYASVPDKAIELLSISKNPD